MTATGHRTRSTRPVEAAAAAVAAVPGPGDGAPPEPPPPSGVRPSVARYLGRVRATEAQLLGALVLVAERHERNYEIARGATTLAAWPADHLAWLEPLEARYGSTADDRPALLRAALLGGSRIGVAGELADLADLALLVEQAQLLWTILVQGGRELRDTELVDVASRAKDHTRRQLAWLRTMIEHEAPDAVAVVPDRGGQLAASLPKRPTSVASIPDALWGPVVGTVMILAVGLLGLAVGQPWLVPSLGPTAVLVAMSPLHPTSRPWNIFAGHVLGLAAGFLAVALVGAAGAPTVLGDHVLVPARVAAAALAIPLAMIAGASLRASHPPAAATTLLVALGGIATTDQALAVVAGVAATTLLAEAARVVRYRRHAPAQRMAPAGPASIISRRLRRA